LVREVFRMALETLRTNKLRSALTVLGVVIGITSIVGMTSLLRGFDESLRDMIRSLGPSTIYVATISGVSLSAGTVTLTSAAAITSFADADVLFNSGDVGTCMEGFEAATPLVAPVGGDSFRGVDRSVYPELLAGSRLSTTVSLGQTVEENIGQLAIAIGQAGGKVTDGVVNSINFWSVVRRGNARVEFTKAGGQLDYGFETAVISTPRGPVRLWDDPDCPIDRARVFNRASHYLRCLGPKQGNEFIHIINDDGNYDLRSTNADAVETRTRSIKNYLQNDTRNHGVCQI
jgi:hypothetical protein